MKTGFFTFGAFALLQLVSAQPHKIRHRYRYERRDVVTEISYTTMTAAAVIVYVDTDGVPYTTSTIGEMPEITSTPSAALSSTSDLSLSPTSEAVEVAAVTPGTVTNSTITGSSSSIQSLASTSYPISSSPAYVPPSAAPSSVVSASSSSSQMPSSAPAATATPGSAIPLGVAYDGYTTTGCSNGQSTCCKSASQIASDFSAMKSYGIIRIYGVDCNQVANSLQNAISNGQKLIVGLYDMTAIQSGVQTIADAINTYANGKWDSIPLVTVGNEFVNTQTYTVSQMVDYLNWARGNLTNVHYTGPVGIVDTVPAVTDNPALCENSDYALVNCHAFFNSHSSAADAGNFVKGQVANVQQACPNKKVIVTESGWPKQGDSNGEAVPSPANQRAALASLQSNFNDSLIFFSAFDDSWKSNSAGTYDAEQYWGFL
ncbi:glycoside hydrolase family 17 protein [Glonium stellatum]|uniref:Glycoside hydrolase family 17 protein n=1 Tax=Glonium stellatum TaxID=574774 RepID=A0A8E2JT25_9PEZI|nr:glycoside hydrolase family 17 protein [Glonium stellatum]